MKNKNYTGIIPGQYSGEKVEAEAFIELKDKTVALIFYDKVKKRLLNVNNWHHVAGMISAKFHVTNHNGKEVNRNVQKGDYLKIDIPGPGSKEGGGYDWVMVEELKEVDENEIQSMGFRVRPVANPSGDKEHIAHFYDESATSSFIIIRKEKKVIAYIVDNNLKPNDDSHSITDKIRHTAVGMSAIGSFSKIQWQNLANGLVGLK